MAQNALSSAPDFQGRYLSGDLSDFFALPPSAKDAALETPRPAPRAPLAAALRRYAQKLRAPKETFAAIERLEHPDSRVVVTGQQVGLLLGQVFTLSKAVTAINLARSLSSDDSPVVPVFWLATQDHDSAEIDHTYLLDLNETLHHLELPLPEGVSAGHLPFNRDDLETLLKSLEEVASSPLQRDEVLALVREAGEGAASYADFFGTLLYRVLGHTGLILLDPLQEDVAPLFKEIIGAELCKPLASSQTINEAGERLKELGFTPQLGRGEGAMNLFLEEEGRRHLLRFDGRHYYTESRTYSLLELQGILEQEPLRLTPAAGLRPVTQDAILPSAIVVVGPGELKYFAQLKGVYEEHGVAMPLVYPRATVTVLEPPVARIMDKYGLTLADLQRDFDGSMERVLLELHGHADVFRERLEQLETLARDLTEHVRGIDVTLERTVKRSEARFENTVGVLQTKSARALKERDEVTRAQFERLRTHLFPNGELQERLLSPFSHFLKFGIKPTVTAFLSLPPEGSHTLRF